MRLIENMATEKRLIDANALEQIFLDESRRLRKQIINDEVSCEEANYIRSFMPTIEWARKTVHGCATVDAVEVVRCKDCVNYCGFEHCKNGICDVDSVSKGQFTRMISVPTEKGELTTADREKLIEILRKPIFPHELVDPIEAVADYLLDSGVTVQEWIPVTERLPETIPCNAGTAYSEAVIVWTDNRKAMIAVWDGIDFLCAADYWEAWGEKITHWMPLPTPPKGE